MAVIHTWLMLVWSSIVVQWTTTFMEFSIIRLLQNSYTSIYPPLYSHTAGTGTTTINNTALIQTCTVYYYKWNEGMRERVSERVSGMVRPAISELWWYWYRALQRIEWDAVKDIHHSVWTSTLTIVPPDECISIFVLQLWRVGTINVLATLNFREGDDWK